MMKSLSTTDCRKLAAGLGGKNSDDANRHAPHQMKLRCTLFCMEMSVIVCLASSKMMARLTIAATGARRSSAKWEWVFVWPQAGSRVAYQRRNLVISRAGLVAA